MFPKIILFPKVVPDPHDIKVHDMFVKAGFTPLVDSIHGTDRYWLQKQLDAGNCKLFYSNTITIDLTNEIDTYDDPVFMVSYNLSETITGEDWREIYEYFNDLYFYGYSVHTSIIKHYDLFEKTINSSHEEKEEMVNVELDDDYSFLEGEISNMDVKLFEIKKPNTLVPYTIVVRNYSKVGYLPIFTSLFICASWGVNRYDALFLKHLWGHLKMDGDFDLDLLLKAHTEKCYPNSNEILAEPEVYRKNLTETEFFIRDKFKAKKRKLNLDK